MPGAEVKQAAAMEREQAPPLISVVTPFFNRREWLEPYLETLERQTLRDFEAIIVDDASTDGLAEAVAGTRPNFPLRYIRLQRNSGGAAARNAGIDEAKGRYIALLDSDDSWRADKLSQHLAQFNAAPDSERLVGLSRQCVIGGGTFVRPRRLISRNDRVGRYLFQFAGIIQSSSMFLMSDLARRARFAEGERGHEDWAFALRLEALGAHFDMLPDALTYYRDDERPARASPLYTRERFDWLERYRELLGEQPYIAARAAFASRMRGDKTINSFAMIRDGLVSGAVPFWRSAYYFGTWTFPSIRRLGVRINKARNRDTPDAT
jgi:glycosyltransferase involved in cell wall biosynthesis